MQALSKVLLAAGLVLATAWAFAAENFPNRPVRWIVPAPPGGGTDAVGRIVSAKLTETWKQQIIIDNRGGAQWIDMRTRTGTDHA